MEYSVIVPVYNSENTLTELFERIKSTLEKITSDFEVIFVDDFSKDTSWQVLKKIKNQNNEFVKLIRFARNFGQHNATFCGFKYAKGDYIITIDDDLQNAPEDITLLIEEIKKSDADLVYGIGEKKRSNTRKLSSYLWKKSTIYIDEGIGEGSSFRILTAALKEKATHHSQAILFIDEVLQWYTHHIQFIKVSHHPRLVGKSSYTGLKLWSFMLRISFNYSIVPLKIMTSIGFLMGIISFLLGLRFIIKKVLFNSNVPGFTATIVAILFSSSLILITLGIIGKYISNIFSQLNRKPSYSIKEIEK